MHAATAATAVDGLAPSPLQALQEGQRIDGRAPFESRPLRLHFSLDDSSCTVQLGRTRVLAVVSAALDAPYADRHSEGSLRFNVEFSPMASPAFEAGKPAGSRRLSQHRRQQAVSPGCIAACCPVALLMGLPPRSADAAVAAGRPGEDAIEVARLIERGLRESRAVDLEALVVLAGGGGTAGLFRFRGEGERRAAATSEACRPKSAAPSQANKRSAAAWPLPSCALA
jgi:hypothetical protein